MQSGDVALDHPLLWHLSWILFLMRRTVKLFSRITILEKFYGWKRTTYGDSLEIDVAAKLAP